MGIKACDVHVLAPLQPHAKTEGEQLQATCSHERKRKMTRTYPALLA